MKVLLLNQTFYPDVASSGQHLADLALELAARGHAVTVITSRRAYDQPQLLFPRQETWHGVHIRRVWSSGFGKSTKSGRVADGMGFILMSLLRLPWLDRQDVVLALTSPPFISMVACAFAHLHGSRFVHWVMDLNPDEAIASGWMRPASLRARFLESVSRLTLRCAHSIVALDNAMRDRILSKGIARSKITVIPPWSHDSSVCFDAAGRESFRRAHGLQGQFVVMYSGNHSACHPLGTVLEAARILAKQKHITFCFVGGGTEFAKVKAEFRLNSRASCPHNNILCLRYQPLELLSGSLSAADLHLVVMGEAMVGIVHPCKVYNLLRIGLPIVYIGRVPSPISEVVAQTPGSACLEHGEVDGLVRHILRVSAALDPGQCRRPFPLAQRFAKNSLLPKLIELME